MHRKLLAVTAVLVAAVIFFLLATLPPPPRQAAGWSGDPSIPGRTVAGAYHVHTTRSDGSGDRAEVAEAAARAGLRFVVFAEHGDGTRPPEAPAYLSGVLCIDAVELSTNGGHYVALGLPAAPYPLGGEAPAVVEDVARLGGFGFAAHPDSPRPELAWTDWTVPFDGVEWLNADSEWRNEPRGRLARVLFDYFLRPGPALASLLDRPVITLTKWDALTSRRPVPGLAGHDAHGGFGRGVEGGGWGRVGIPSYEASFRTFATRVILDAPMTGGDAGADAAALLAAMRAGRMYTVMDALAAPGYLDFRAGPPGGAPAGRSAIGSVVPPGPATISVDASLPPGAEIVVLRSSAGVLGAEIKRSSAGSYSAGLDAASGAIRVEVRVPGGPGNPPVPWLVSNPIYFMAEPSRQPAAAPDGEVEPVPGDVAWHVEHDDGSSGTLSASDGALGVDYRLAPGSRARQFVALAADMPGRFPSFESLSFTGRAAGPMRVSVQLRYGSGGEDRWGTSVYLGTEPRHFDLRVDDMVPMDGQTGRAPDPAGARSMLFVVDLTNAEPGSEGRFELAGLGFRR